MKQDFCKIHIDTSIKCKDEEKINSNIIFDRTLKILKNDKIQKGIKNRFIVIGTPFVKVEIIKELLKLVKNKLKMRS